jgi:ATP-dependent DNA ligase
VKTLQFLSSSTDAIYTVQVKDGVISCNCPGYTKRKVRECKHTKEVAKNEGITPAPAPPAEVQQGLFAAPEGFIKPMLASATMEPIEAFEGEGWILEEKYDGHRMIIRVEGFEVIAWSRQGNIRRLPVHIERELRKLSPGTYDGELYVPGGVSTDVTDLTRDESLRLVLFDMIKTSSADLAPYSYITRRQFLEESTRVLPERERLNGPVGMSPIQNVSALTLKRIYDGGGEGAIVKLMSSTYEPNKRSKSWVKFKKKQHETFTLIGFEEGLLGPQSKMVLRDKHGVVISVKTLNDAWRAAFAKNADRYLGCDVVVEFQEKTRDGRYRHPMVDHFPNGEL